MFEKYLSEFRLILNNLVTTDINGNMLSEGDSLKTIFKKLDNVKANGNTVYLVGNGGSSSLVSHVSVDLINTCKIKSVPLTDSSQITCFSNDFGYEKVFSKPLETFLSSDDVLIAVSSSGTSKNIINAVEIARNNKIFVITLSGFNDNNALRKSGNVNFWLNSKHYGMVEIGHSLIMHYLTDTYCKLF